MDVHGADLYAVGRGTRPTINCLARMQMAHEAMKYLKSLPDAGKIQVGRRQPVFLTTLEHGQSTRVFPFFTEGEGKRGQARGCCLRGQYQA